jgi:hypothetical protein
VNRLFGTSYTDLCYGYNAFWARCLPALQVDCDGFEVETLLNIRAARARLAIREVPSYEFSRIHGASNLNVVREACGCCGRSRERLDLARSPAAPTPRPVAPEPALAEAIDVRVARLPSGLRR